jgi:hypothetical protein
MEEYKCPICLDNKEPLDYISDCDHIFHQKCIDEWIVASDKNDKECPVCRTVILVIEPEKREEITVISVREIDSEIQMNRRNYLMGLFIFVSFNIIEYTIVFKDDKNVNVNSLVLFISILLYNSMLFLFIRVLLLCCFNRCLTS